MSTTPKILYCVWVLFLPIILCTFSFQELSAEVFSESTVRYRMLDMALGGTYQWYKNLPNPDANDVEAVRRWGNGIRVQNSGSFLRVNIPGRGWIMVWSGTTQRAPGMEAWLTVSISGSGTKNTGTRMTLTLSSKGDPHLPFQVGSSFGNGPIPIGKRKLGLSPDNLLVLSTSGMAFWIFQNYSGTLDVSGKSTAKINIPNIPALRGTRIHSAFVTLDPSAPFGIKTISNTYSFTIK